MRYLQGKGARWTGGNQRRKREERKKNISNGMTKVRGGDRVYSWFRHRSLFLREGKGAGRRDAERQGAGRVWTTKGNKEKRMSKGNASHPIRRES